MSSVRVHITVSADGYVAGPTRARRIRSARAAEAPPMGLSECSVEALLAVSDLDTTTRFYEHQLGLVPGEEEQQGVRYPCAHGTRIFVYLSQDSADKWAATLAGCGPKIGRVELLQRRLIGELLDPRRGFERTRAELEVRWDPLTGHSARLVRGPGPLLPASDLDLEEIGQQFARSCPFCAPRIERMTPKLSSAVWPDGRIRHGQAVLFPNLLAYAAHSSVS